MKDRVEYSHIESLAAEFAAKKRLPADVEVSNGSTHSASSAVVGSSQRVSDGVIAARRLALLARADGMSVGACAAKAEVSEPMLQRWLDEDDAFARAFANAEGMFDAYLYEQVKKASKDDPKLALQLLERREQAKHKRAIQSEELRALKLTNDLAQLKLNAGGVEKIDVSVSHTVVSARASFMQAVVARIPAIAGPVIDATVESVK